MFECFPTAGNVVDSCDEGHSLSHKHCAPISRRHGLEIVDFVHLAGYS